MRPVLFVVALLVFALMVIRAPLEKVEHPVNTTKPKADFPFHKLFGEPVEEEK